ncbi:hypothetical protein [Peribacillus muralis]|uniref:hypothetical protein n=1 Tax=Peribacillus muralis TaxID=264697 RepID=UPI003D021CAE
MKELKPVAPGETITMRIPMNVDPKILEFINMERSVKRNKYLLQLLFSKIQEEMKDDSNSMNIKLPVSLNSEQKSALKQSVVSLLTIMTNTSEEDLKVKEEEIDYDIFSGLIEDD